MPARILLIDDTDATRQPLGDLLRRRGYAVDEAADGTRGLELLRQHPDTAVVVLDLLMPNGNGWWFREQQLGDPAIAQVPVIVFTVAAKNDYVKYALRARDVLTKPGSVDDLFVAIADCCGPGMQVA